MLLSSRFADACYGNVGRESKLERAWVEWNLSGMGASAFKVVLKKCSHAGRPESWLWEYWSLGATVVPGLMQCCGEGYQGSVCQRVQLLTHQRGTWEPQLVLIELTDIRPEYRGEEGILISHKEMLMLLFSFLLAPNPKELTRRRRSG